MEKKKLLVTASTFPRWNKDTEPRFVLDLCRFLEDEYDVTVLVPAAPGALSEEELEGLHVKRYHYFPIHKWETLCYPGAIVPRIKEKKVRVLLVPWLFAALWVNMLKMRRHFDLIHAHWLIPQGIVQSCFKKPYVVTGHGGDVTSLNNGIMKTLKAKCLKRASAVVAVSEHLRAVEKEIASDVEPYVISMGVDTGKFGTEYKSDNFFGQNDRRVVLFAGRLAEKKGVRYLIEAMAKVENSLLYIVGDGPLRSELEELASRGDAKIVFAGSKSHDELRKIYASADVFVAPSVTAADGDQEGLPTTILEAMASGIPVVASNHSGISLLIEDGVNGLLCEEKAVEQIASNLNRVLSDDILRRTLIDNGLKTAAEYDYRVLAGKYKEIYKKILND